MSFDFELYFWIAAGIAGVITFVILWLLAKKNSENYVDWIAEEARNKK